MSDLSGALAARKASSSSTAGLCSSCDRCRARKTRCDGSRPCSNCAAKYLKKHKLADPRDLAGIDPAALGCVYSPAKRRGPVPGKAGAARKASEALAVQHEVHHAGLGVGGVPGVGGGQLGEYDLSAAGGMAGMGGGMGMGGMGMGGGDDLAELRRQLQLQHQLERQMAEVGGSMDGAVGAVGSPLAAAAQMLPPLPAADPVQEQLYQLQQLQRQQEQLQRQIQAQNNSAGGAGAGAGGFGDLGGGGGAGGMDLGSMNLGSMAVGMGMDHAAATSEPAARRARTNPQAGASNGTAIGGSGGGLPKSVQKHLPLLSRSNVDGNRLRSYYDLGIDDLFRLPPVPTDEEYGRRLQSLHLPGLSSVDPNSSLPRFDQAALQAARFSEIALGALANNQIALALELSNATVLCLRECTDEPADPTCLYDVARAYFLHGMFRSYRGDMVRYFKYRRVCLTHLARLDGVVGVEALLAAVSFHDSWAYMIHNASEASLPDIDDAIPPLPAPQQHHGGGTGTDVVAKYGTATNPSYVAANPLNQMWIQGPPPVFINNEAPALSRSLDALACAIRSCCDQANARFEGMARELMSQNGGGGDNDGGGGCGALSATGSAVLANEDELCSRNMVLSAFTLLQQHEAAAIVPGGGGQGTVSKNHGHHLVVSAMDAFLEGGDEEEAGGFTDSQIQGLLSVCNTVVEHPLLLYQAGPTYHMIANAAVLLCHLLNGMHAQRGAGGGEPPGEMEAALFDEVLDTYLSVRKLLSIHRRKLPVRLRCHGIPRPNLAALGGGGEPGAPFIDLGETLMCGSRGCQGFVLMACSPCVAAERARAAAQKQEVAAQQEALANGIDAGLEDLSEFDKELFDLGQEFDIDDDALLSVLSQIVAT